MVSCGQHITEQLRQEVRGEIGREIRSEVKELRNEIRREIRGEVEELRSEVREELRSEVRECYSPATPWQQLSIDTR